MRIHTVKHSLISVNVVLEILCKIGEFGLKNNNEIPHANHASCRIVCFAILEIWWCYRHFLNHNIAFVRLCGHIMWCLYLREKKLDVAAQMILSYGKEKRLNTKFIHRLTRTGSRSISNQALSESQSWAGFSISLGTVEPPANKKRHSS